MARMSIWQRGATVAISQRKTQKKVILLEAKNLKPILGHLLHQTYQTVIYMVSEIGILKISMAL